MVVERAVRMLIMDADTLSMSSEQERNHQDASDLTMYRGFCENLVHVNDDIPIFDKNQTSNENVDDILITGAQEVRGHWIQMQKIGMQGYVVENTFLRLFEMNRQLWPLWKFTRDHSGDLINDDYTSLKNDHRFRLHCANVQTFITVIMQNIDNVQCLNKVMFSLGVHHFFYDVNESYFESFHTAFVTSLKETLKETDTLDDQLEEAWNNLLIKLKAKFSEGIEHQRLKYIRRNVTERELEQLKSVWKRTKDSVGLQKLIRITCEHTAKRYARSIIQLEIDTAETILCQVSTIISFVQYEVQAFDMALKSFSLENGLMSLIGRMKIAMQKRFNDDLCPTVIREAFIEGIFTALDIIHSTDSSINDGLRIAMLKLYRAIEQINVQNLLDGTGTSTI
ncbi:hypothetical protein AB6A40_008595 [Gnathostoma spinigerum]|uniref:Globin domain-containing protein n=1 Tax=Gnathostoma spinigerum TaxID=75299 RepID=A0ABD6ERE7_9BILA